jgi:hypothetical protein
MPLWDIDANADGKLADPTMLHLLFASGLIRFRYWTLTMLADVLEPTAALRRARRGISGPIDGQPMCG